MKKKVFIKCQKGASAVEFAIVLPLLLLFVFGIIEFGILFYDKAIITNASREGARTAILHDTESNGDPRTVTAAEVQAVVFSYCSSYLINFSGATTPTVTTSPLLGTPPNEYRTVTVTFGYNFLVLPNILGAFFGGSLSGPIPLTAVTRMRSEWQGGT
jgi:Flp pilus assembly protein TadG